MSPANLERVAVFDIGSNAIRLVVADLIHNTRKYVIVEHLRVPMRTGKDVFEYGIFKEDTFRKTKDVFRDLLRIVATHRPSKIQAYATASFREAKNADSLTKYLAEKTGLHINIITGEQEADLIYKALKNSFDFKKGKSILMDIGGGSSEFTLLQNANVIKTISIPVGALKLFQSKSLAEYEGIFENFRKSFTDFLPPDFFTKENGSETLFIGTGGNLRRMGKLKKSMLKKQDVTYVMKQDLIKIHHDLKDYDVKQLVRNFRLKKDRAEVIRPAMDLTMAIFNLIPSNRLELPNLGLSNGILESLVVLP